jgi:hypothetical protein
MSEPSIKTVKRLFAKSGNRCAFPDCKDPIVEDSGVVTGQICHIKAKSINGPRYDQSISEKQINQYDNLILLCSRHHTIIDTNPSVYDEAVLIEMKRSHEKSNRREETSTDNIYSKILLNDYRNINIANNSGNIIIGSPNAIQVKSLTIKSTRGKINILPPSGTISADLKLLAYIKHLIKRYNEFASSDPTRKSKFFHGAIYKNIETNFGIKYDLVAIERSKELIEYLHKRIDTTRQARINKGKGYKNYSSFEDFSKEHF